MSTHMESTIDMIDRYLGEPDDTDEYEYDADDYREALRSARDRIVELEREVARSKGYMPPVARATPLHDD